MEILSFIFSAENIRTAIVLVVVLYLHADLRHKLTLTKIELKIEILDEINKLLDVRFAEFHKMLKENDFAHLERTIKALTYMLEKNKFLSVDDKNFIDDHLND